MAYLCILRSAENGAYYVGSCKDLKKRLHAHNAGFVKSTKRYIPWQLVYNEEFQSLRGARQRELQIKLWKSRKAIGGLLRHFKI
ncbi:hypothetical protein A3D09_04160 [Candidatus Collierbacteria bacterium RIFCSPHIGHO2_02_FULL_49_10]|uniref:GIY-YIG domain-containing protein n=1 Tax=Candidatus Collierbacteria bacterium RIFCSPHIGHO2_02_FULL_49_10 TaxID=1817723 RepID=A0A1F5ETU8_9BACT|nr:MAG: hypothetical protein A3D09_04160 [Candidatus Collierbacteria bacterium RIFCSPHIGHO2_02_FULL_49_10]